MARRFYLLRVFSYRLAGARFATGQPAFTHACANERAPGHKVAGEPPGAHPEGRYGSDQLAFETTLPECLGPHVGPFGVFCVPVQEQYAQGVEMSQEALAVRAGFIPVASTTVQFLVPAPPSLPMTARPSPGDQAGAGCLR